MNTKFLKKKAIELRVESLDMVQKLGFGSSGAICSVMEILVAIFYGQLSKGAVFNCDFKNSAVDNDFFVFGKTNALPALYAILADLKLFPREDLANFGSVKSKLQTWANLKVPGIQAPVTAVGCGLSLAVGAAISHSLDKKSGRIFAVIDAKQMQCGAFWEALLAAAHYKCENLTIFLEYDDCQMDGGLRKVMNVEPVLEKFEAFGAKVFRVNDGHDFDQILTNVHKAFGVIRRPQVVLLKTTVGKFLPFGEGKQYYYSAPLSKQEMKEFLVHAEREWMKI
jgi:transketolase